MRAGEQYYIKHTDNCKTRTVVIWAYSSDPSEFHEDVVHFIYLDNPALTACFACQFIKPKSNSNRIFSFSLSKFLPLVVGRAQTSVVRETDYITYTERPYVRSFIEEGYYNAGG